MSSPPARAPVVWLFDVDNTLLDNDAVERDLAAHIERELGAECRERYFVLFERLRAELGYADYLGTLQRYRLEHATDPRILELSLFLIEYPFAERLYPGALDVVARARGWGVPVVLSDGDVVFQPWKIRRSGIWDAVGGNALIYIHKEQMLGDVAARYPADHYVLVDDKVRILSAVKRIWAERVTTVFPRQGKYAADRALLRRHRPPDVTLEHIAELAARDPASIVAAARRPHDPQGPSRRSGGS